MAEIVKIKKDGVIQYPITKPECVIDENGKNVLQLIKENGGGSTPDLSEYLTKEEFNEASEDFATTDALEGYATTQQLTELSENVAELRHDLGECDSRAGSALDMAEKHEEQLTELSSEVSELSEKIDNLPSAESSVFEAKYGETTFAEIVEASNAGKSVTCRYGQTIAQLISITDSVIYFTSIDIKRETRFVCYPSNLWTYTDHNTGHELKTLDNGNAQITIAGKTAEVATPQYVENAIQQSGGGGASNEWKCVADRRLLEGEKDIIFTTYADGTPLKANEVVVQLLIDKKAAQNITGYVGIKSTNNQNEALYGSLNYEQTSVDESNQRLQQMRICASPFFTIAEIAPDVKSTVASPTTAYYQGGNLKTFQIYEDIVYVRIITNGTMTSAAPYLKVYAR